MNLEVYVSFRLFCQQLEIQLRRNLCLGLLLGDHCRHTTFETVTPDQVIIDSVKFQVQMQEAFDYYVKIRGELGISKPMTLMDIAASWGKYHVQFSKTKPLKFSEEINACSFSVTVNNQGQEEEWLVQFKNEDSQPSV